MSLVKLRFCEYARSRFLAYALYDSVKDLDFKSVKYLLKVKKADPNHVLMEFGVSPIHIVAGLEDEWFCFRVLRICLSCGGDPNVRSVDGLTPVHVAAIWKRMNVLKLLTERGGSLYLLDNDGYTPLDYLNNSSIQRLSSSLQKYSLPTTNEFIHFSSRELTSPAEPVEISKNGSIEPDSYYSILQDEVSDIMNDAFMVDDTAHSHISQAAESCLSDIEIDFGFLEVHERQKELVANKFRSPLIRPYLPLNTLDRDLTMWAPNLHSERESRASLDHSSVKFKTKVLANEAMRQSIISRLSSDSSIYFEAEDFLPDLSDGSVSSCPTEQLKCRLQERRILHGPIVKSTKRVYLYQLKKVPNGLSGALSTHQSQPKEYSDEVIATFNGKLVECIDKWALLESKMIKLFNDRVEQESKLDSSKQYFTYLLLDPTLTEGITKSASEDNLIKSWPIFLGSVFYIGKGKNSRPLDHLIDAVKSNQSSTSSKIKRIKDIWAKGVGIVCIRIFHNISEAEALTREACMISALSVARLTNVQSGRYYGGLQKWTLKNKRQLGVVLLYRAMMMLIAEGERQLFPSDFRR